MAEGLFENAAPFGDAAPTATAPEGNRRTKLYPWDSVASQLFEPHGESAFDNMSLKKVWEAAMKGNRKAAYHSHLCASQANDAWHVGAGLSLTAASLLAAIRHFRTEEMKQLLKPDLYAKVEAELGALEPVFIALNMGKGSQVQRDTGSFREAKRQKTSASTAEPNTATPEEVQRAAVTFHAWLEKPKSPFRSLLFILSGSNTYYAAHVAETVARAAVQEKPMSQDDFKNAMIARMSQAPAPAATAKGSDASGLFDL